MVAEPRYSPDFMIEINDRGIPARLRASIQSVRFQNGLEGADRVELQIVNENLRWLDNPLLALDQKLSLSIGYQPESLERLFVGEIVTHEASFPSGGPPTLTIAAQDLLHRTMKGTKRRWFAIPVPMERNVPLRDKLVASVVSGSDGLIPIIDPLGAALSVVLGSEDAATALGDPEEVQKLIRKQVGENDYEFLQRIARDNGWEMFVDHGASNGGQRLRFQSSLDRLSPDTVLRYGESLIDFTPRETTAGEITAVTASIWVSATKASFNVTVGWDWKRKSLTLDVRPADSAFGSGDGGPPSASLELIDEPLTLASAPRAIVSRLVPRLNQRLTGSGSTIGNPKIVAGNVLQLEGVGVGFGGLYRVTGAVHTIDSSGYRTSFDIRKEIWFASVPLAKQGAVPVNLAG
jgi:uncharacterized protein